MDKFKSRLNKQEDSFEKLILDSIEELKKYDNNELLDLSDTQLKKLENIRKDFLNLLKENDKYFERKLLCEKWSLNGTIIKAFIANKFLLNQLEKKKEKIGKEFKRLISEKIL